MKIYFLVCFDISDAKVRQRVGKILLAYGKRVQHSVFEIAVHSSAELQQLQQRLSTLLREEKELRFYHLCMDCRKKSERIDGLPLATMPAVVIL